MTNHETNSPTSNEAFESAETQEQLSSLNTTDNEQDIVQHNNHIYQELKPDFIQNEFEKKTAGFWLRFWAFMIDSMIAMAIVGIAVNPIFYMMDWSLKESVWYAPISIISAIIYYAYFVLMTYYFSQTIGKMIFGLRVTTLDGSKLSFSTVVFREWIGRLISNAILPLYFLVVFLDKNQGLHDYFADTMVIQENVYLKVIKPSVTPSNVIQEETPVASIN